MWFNLVNEGTYVHVVCLSTSLDIENCFRDLGDPTMAIGTTKGQPCRVVRMFPMRGLDTL